jgi:hypothetical protein
MSSQNIGGSVGTSTPIMVRSEAIKWVLSSGTHVLIRTDDQHAIVFYRSRD